MPKLVIGSTGPTGSTDGNMTEMRCNLRTHCSKIVKSLREAFETRFLKDFAGFDIIQYPLVKMVL